MWTSRYDRAVVREELATIAQHGCTVTRSFCYWPDFVPEPERLDPQVLDRFSDFLDAHLAIGLSTIPTFIVGHMSGENWDPAWRSGRDLYRDVWMVAQQAWFVEQLARRFGSHPAIAGWLLTNEMPIYGGPAEVPEVTAWARLLLAALRAGGAHQPASIGDGAWGVEMSGSDNGYSMRALTPLVDFVGPHVYPMSDDPVRQNMQAAFTCELARTFGAPVVLEEFGVTSDFVDGPNAANYYRQVLHTTLLAGAEGWLAWNNCDYDDLGDEAPYRHHPFEMHFGLTDRDGRPKPQFGEIARFAELLGRLPAGPRWPMPAEVALVVGEDFERVLPFSSGEDRRDVRAQLLQAYIAAREADLDVELVREHDGFGGDHRLLLLPSRKKMTAPGMRRLEQLAQAGATVYLSFHAGSTDNQRGPWIPWLQDLFGVRHHLRYGLVDPIEDDAVVLQMTEAFGDLQQGETLRLRVAGNAHSRCRLPVEPDGAEVLAVDGTGRPALLRRALGAGALVLCTYPIEQMAAATPWVNPEPTWRLYSALAAAAGVTRPVRCDDPRILIGRVVAADQEVVIAVNASDEFVSAPLILDDGRYLAALDGGATAVEQVSLDAYEVEVLVSRAGVSPQSPTRTAGAVAK